MNMSLRPILSTLARHRISAGLIVVEVALALAFVSHALHMITVRAERLVADRGLSEHELVNIDLRAVSPIKEADPLTAEDLRRLRALPGVRGAAVSNQVIYGDSHNNSGVSNRPERGGTRVSASNYDGDEHLLPVLGLKLVAGRNFQPEEVLSASRFASEPDLKVPVLIVNRARAEAMYPGQNAVGKPLYVFSGPSTIVGVVETLPNTNPRANRSQYALIAPVRQSFRGGTYMLRVEPGQAQQVIKAATALIREIDPRRGVRRGETLSDMRKAYDAEDRAMTWLLAGVCIALLAVTAFGIVGLASFWVEQRTRMIGVRRALGATKSQIRQYFQLENLLLCGLGVVVGAGAALAISQFVMQPQGAPALPWFYLPLGAVLLLWLGQLAVLAPARRASGLPAAAAMRA
jgi:putative ABC transport system permease protein